MSKTACIDCCIFLLVSLPHHIKHTVDAVYMCIFASPQKLDSTQSIALERSERKCMIIQTWKKALFCPGVLLSLSQDRKGSGRNRAFIL